ncbi:MAG: hypoxanthine phosphoribosyltransferase [Bacteroidota bacterium]|nr:hypoxanthine phosphoribosyltransferase [Bacteroidota bacterium]
MKRIKILDKEFEVSITEEQIQKEVKAIAEQMNKDFEGEDVLFMAILNGAFMFASDLFKHIDIQAQITFVKMASYEGTVSSGNVKRLIGINEDIKGKTVIVLEDIVDTGLTMESIKKQLQGYEPKAIKIATMLHKPDAFQKDYAIDYIGMNIPDRFIVGYGLDYDGYGRNIKEIYTLVQ